MVRQGTWGDATPASWFLRLWSSQCWHWQKKVSFLKRKKKIWLFLQNRGHRRVGRVSFIGTRDMSTFVWKSSWKLGTRCVQLGDFNSMYDFNRDTFLFLFQNVILTWVVSSLSSSWFIKLILAYISLGSLHFAILGSSLFGIIWCTFSLVKLLTSWTLKLISCHGL